MPVQKIETDRSGPKIKILPDDSLPSIALKIIAHQLVYREKSYPTTDSYLQQLRLLHSCIEQSGIDNLTTQITKKVPGMYKTVIRKLESLYEVAEVFGRYEAPGPIFFGFIESRPVEMFEAITLVWDIKETEVHNVASWGWKQISVGFDVDGNLLTVGKKLSCIEIYKWRKQKDLITTAIESAYANPYSGTHQRNMSSNGR